MRAMADPTFLSARRQASLIKRRAIGALELLDIYIRRIQQYDASVNSVVVRDFDRARTRAKKLDRASSPIGPLHGVPMTVKESFDIAGLPTTWGVPEKRGNVAAHDSLVVERLLRSGANVFGKTNVPVMLGDWQSFNPVYGSTRNPWDLDRTPGGSSGGGAAALAAGLSALECGSDIGGSIRQPAHACGVFGHKPTWGLIPPRGHAPVPGIAAMTDISVVGPLARSADDLAVALDILAGPDESQTAMQFALPAPRLRSLRGLRIAVWPRDPATHTDREISDAIEGLAKHLKREGAKVSLTARPSFDPREAFNVYLKLLSAAMSGRLAEDMRERIKERAQGYAAGDLSVGAVMDQAASMSHAEWLAANELRHKMRRAWSEFFHDWDVLLCPVHAVPAQLCMEDEPTFAMKGVVNGETIPWNEMLFWPGITGGFHLPASVAPLGFNTDGLPMGVQIVGPLYGDRTTIIVAQMLEAGWRAFEPPIEFS